MCNPLGPFKLCTCSEKIDKNKPHWILRTQAVDTGMVNHIVGQMVQPDWEKMLQGNSILEYLNSENVFDFDFTPKQGDRLEVHIDSETGFYYIFGGKKWNEDEPFGALVVYKYKKRLKGEIQCAKEE